MIFPDWVTTNYAAGNSHLEGPMSVDRLLDAEMKGYADYLEFIQSAAQKELEDLGGNVNEPRNAQEELLANAIGDAGSRWKYFTELATHIRNRPYNFEPSDPAIPSFVEFAERNCPPPGTIPIYNRSTAYDAYEGMITAAAGINSPRICVAYEISREERTEADRRELFGLPREPDTQALQKLHRLRDEMRELICNALEDTFLDKEIVESMVGLFHDNIRLIRCFIACEYDISEEQEATYRRHMATARKYLTGDAASLGP